MKRRDLQRLARFRIKPAERVKADQLATRPSWWRTQFRALLGLLSLAVVLPAHAELDFDGLNRFIYNEGSKRLSIVIVNKGQHPTLAQSSVAWGDGGSTPLPVAINKPLQIIAPGERGAVEVFYQGQGLPADRESYLLLSVLDVSQAPREPNTVTVAVHHHFKLFFRPKLTSTTDEAIANLTWKAPAGAGLPTISNASPYYITLSDISLKNAAGTLCGKVVDHLMIAPFAQAALENVECQSSVSAARYDYVTDTGVIRPYEVQFSPNAESRGIAGKK
ncbi:fimbrial biogenesis chaperone [Pseudomonas aeruginosa]